MTYILVFRRCLFLSLLDKRNRHDIPPRKRCKRSRHTQVLCTRLSDHILALFGLKIKEQLVGYNAHLNNRSKQQTSLRNPTIATILHSIITLFLSFKSMTSCWDLDSAYIATCTSYTMDV